jgi:dTDP-glucose 4,6-dehydratase
VGELLCAIAHQEHGLEATIARCFACVGPHLPLDAHFAIGNFIRDAMKGEPIKVKDGTPYRSYLYAADLAVWLWTILFKGVACHPYNVGSEQEITIESLARTVASAEDGSVLVQPLSLIHSSHAYRYVPSVRFTHSSLGLNASIPLVGAIQRTIAWCKEQDNV